MYLKCVFKICFQAILKQSGECAEEIISGHTHLKIILILFCLCYSLLKISSCNISNLFIIKITFIYWSIQKC